MSSTAAITGMGLVITKPDEVPDATKLAVEAIALACDEAGITPMDLDGLLVNRNELVAEDHLTLDLARRGPFGMLTSLYELESKGTTMSVLLEHASRLVDEGRAGRVVVVFSDAAIRPGRRAGSAFAAMGGDRGVRGLERANGMLGAVAAYALLARHFMQERGAGGDDLFAVARSQREWASMNPLATAQSPLTREEYMASPLVAAPLRRLDCARPVSGAAALVVTRSSEAPASGPRPVFVTGSAQRYAMRRRKSGVSAWAPAGAREAFDEALRQAGRSRADLDMLQIYDPFTVVPLVMLEELGVIAEGEAGRLVRAGGTGPGGRLPVNTGGGQISGFYLQGATPVVEAVTQLRGDAGARQVPSAETAMVVAVGGRLEGHSSLCLGVER